MDPLTWALIGGLFGAGKTASDAIRNTNQKKRAAETERWSPWTGMQAPAVQGVDAIGDLMMGGLTGAMMGQSLKSLQGAPKLAETPIVPSPAAASASAEMPLPGPGAPQAPTAPAAPAAPGIKNHLVPNQPGPLGQPTTMQPNKGLMNYPSASFWSQVNTDPYEEFMASPRMASRGY